MARLLAEQKLLAPSALSSPSLHHHHPLVHLFGHLRFFDSAASAPSRLSKKRLARHAARSTPARSPPSFRNHHLHPHPHALSSASARHLPQAHLNETQHRYPLSLVASSSGDPFSLRSTSLQDHRIQPSDDEPCGSVVPVRPAAERCQDGRIQDQDHQDVQEPKVHKQLSRIHLFCARQPSFPGVITVFRRGRGDSHSSLRSSATNAPAAATTLCHSGPHRLQTQRGSGCSTEHPAIASVVCRF